jgi:hypothetical protein
MNKRIILTSLLVALIFSSFIIYSSFAQTLPICVAPQQYLYWQSGQHAAGYVPFASTSINFLMRSPIYVSGGNVGIGTANPAALLHLGGTGITPTIRLGTDRAGRNFQIVSDTGGPLLDFQLDNGTSLMTIRSTGNVGIGTTNPQAKLHVIGDILSSNRVTANQFCIGNSCINQWPLQVPQYWTLSGNNLYTSSTNWSVGIGTTSPQYKLQVVSGSGRWTAINADGSIVVNRDGAPPYILFQGSGGGISYIYNPSEGTRGRAMAFYTQADGQSYSEKVRITGAGNVGIGTTAPQNRLHVSGGEGRIISEGTWPGVWMWSTQTTNRAFVGSASANNDIGFWTSGAGWGLVMLQNGNVGIGTNAPRYKLHIKDSSNHPITLQTDGGYGIRFSDAADAQHGTIGVSASKLTFSGFGNGVVFNTGNVGIGTTNPQAKLHVIGDILSSNRVTANQFCIGNSCITQWPLQVPQYWTLSGNNLYTSSTNWSVGIGTTSPQYKLQVVSGSGRWTAINADGSIVVNRDGAPPYILFQGSGGGISYIYNPSEGTRGRAMAFYTQADGQSYSEKVRITGAGNVGIGTTAPQNRLHVSGGEGRIISEGTWPGVWMWSTQTTNRAFVGSASANNDIGFWTSGAGWGLVMLQNGNVGIGTNAPRYKLHIKDSSNHPITLQTDGGYGIRFSDAADAQHGTIGVSASKLTFSGFGNGVVFNTGNVGIGTTNPQAKLHVIGDILSSNRVTANQFCIGNSCITQWPLQVPQYWTLSGNNLYTSSTNWNVGIGTTNPQAKLHVAGRIYQTGLGGSTFFGFEAGLNDNLNNRNNTFIGYQAGRSNTSGYYNTALGFQALYSNTTGGTNIAIGNYALYSNTTAYSNIAIGYLALFYNTTGGTNIALGNYALYYNTTGGYNTAIGNYALYYNTTGYYNTAMGNYALYSNTTGYYNTAIGYSALLFNTTGLQNTAIGNYALSYNTTGGYNTAVGSHAGSYIADGATPNAASTNSIYIGALTKASFSGATNEIVIGYNAVGAGSNSVVLGNDSITKTILKGNVGIGTTNPQAKLEVVGAIRFTPTSQPSNATTGMMYFDQSSGVFKCFQKDERGNYGWVDCVRGITPPPGGGVATLTVPVRIYDSSGQRLVLEINEEY